MRLRFIGQDGSLGLHHKLIYKVALRNGTIGEPALIMSEPVYCPYATEEAFWKNWEVPGEAIRPPDPERQEAIRVVRQYAWDEGYAACKRGDQPHNPYRKDPDA